ncbi:MAG TPA: TRAP transporter large permease subunit, partial [Candidatus Polarisedimenticolia bacterium]|nr:TRAP transporter large permease subunit [Candidatus Polarisedimenticolia bacterium]
MNEIQREEPRVRPAWQRWLHAGENGLLVAVLAMLVLLPLLEAILRKFTSLSVKGSSGFIQHFTLLVSVLGGAVAAREGRLLSLSSLTSFLKGRWLAAATVINGGVATAVSVLLCIVGTKYVLSQPGDALIAYGIPVRAFQVLLPVGYGLVALRLWWHSSPNWTGRGVTLAMAGALVWIACRTPIDPARLVWPALITLLIATILGAPVFTTLGGAAMILFWGAGRPPGAVPLEHYELVTQHILASLPLFTMAGYFLAEGGASKRLVRLFRAFFSPLRGGPAIVTALVCAFFTSFTGASGVTILALGGLLMPVLISAKYSEKSALGLVTSAGSLGLLFPPCLPLIVYAAIAQVQMANLELPPGTPRPELGINQLFLGGIGPGILLVLLTAWWGIRVGPRDAERPAFSRREAMAALMDAKWELLLPLIVLGVMFTGLATPVEA